MYEKSQELLTIRANGLDWMSDSCLQCVGYSLNYLKLAKKLPLAHTKYFTIHASSTKLLNCNL